MVVNTNLRPFDAKLGRTVEKLLSAQEVADLLGIPLASLYAWNSRGVGPRRVHVGKYVRYRPVDVDNFVTEQYAR